MGKNTKKECIAMLLAGGQGTRLGVLTSNVAKPAVPFGAKYRIIDFPLSNSINSGIDTIGVLTQYRPFELHQYSTLINDISPLIHATIYWWLFICFYILHSPYSMYRGGCIVMQIHMFCSQALKTRKKEKMCLFRHIFRYLDGIYPYFNTYSC